VRALKTIIKLTKQKIVEFNLKYYHDSNILSRERLALVS
jgi:hypothetical protein